MTTKKKNWISGVNASIKRREYVWIKRIPELWKKVMEDK